MDGKACWYSLFYMKPHWRVNKTKHLKAYNLDFLISDIARKQVWFLITLQNDKAIILVSKWSQTHVEYIISKISACSVYNISLILLGHSVWSTYTAPKLCAEILRQTDLYLLHCFMFQQVRWWVHHAWLLLRLLYSHLNTHERNWSGVIPSS